MLIKYTLVSCNNIFHQFILWWFLRGKWTFFRRVWSRFESKLYKVFFLMIKGILIIHNEILNPLIFVNELLKKTIVLVFIYFRKHFFGDHSFHSGKGGWNCHRVPNKNSCSPILKPNVADYCSPFLTNINTVFLQTSICSSQKKSILIIFVMTLFLSVIISLWQFQSIHVITFENPITKRQ